MRAPGHSEAVLNVGCCHIADAKCPSALGAVYKDHRYRAHQLIQHYDSRPQERHDTIRRHAKIAYELALEVFGAGDTPPLFL